MTQRAPFPCPRCGQPTRTPISYYRPAHGDQYRVCECEECGRFVTTTNGGPETYSHFVDEAPEPEPHPELEPLDLAALDPVRETLERARLRAIWGKAPAAGELRPPRLRNGSGYEDRDDGKRFYEE